MTSFFGQVLSVMEDAEVMSAAPVLNQFLTWVQQNPGSATNPLQALPQLQSMGAQFIAAQTTAQNSVIQSVAALTQAALNQLVAKVTAPAAPSAPPSA